MRNAKQSAKKEKQSQIANRNLDFGNLFALLRVCLSRFLLAKLNTNSKTHKISETWLRSRFDLTFEFELTLQVAVCCFSRESRCSQSLSAALHAIARCLHRPQRTCNWPVEWRVAGQLRGFGRRDATSDAAPIVRTLKSKPLLRRRTFANRTELEIKTQRRAFAASVSAAPKRAIRARKLKRAHYLLQVQLFGKRTEVCDSRFMKAAHKNDTRKASHFSSRRSVYLFVAPFINSALKARRKQASLFNRHSNHL